MKWVQQELILLEFLLTSDLMNWKNSNQKKKFSLLLTCSFLNSFVWVLCVVCSWGSNAVFLKFLPIGSKIFFFFSFTFPVYCLQTIQPVLHFASFFKEIYFIFTFIYMYIHFFSFFSHFTIFCLLLPLLLITIKKSF
jgi:hypothetical protein